MTPTGNLEAGAGDLVAVAWEVHFQGAPLISNLRSVAEQYRSDGQPVEDLVRRSEAAAQLAAVTAERDEALALVNYAEDISKQITTENARLREALEKIADIAKRNHGRQNEKMADIEPIARAALSQEALK